MSDYSSDEMEEEDDELTIKQDRAELLLVRKVATNLLILFIIKHSHCGRIYNWLLSVFLGSQFFLWKSDLLLKLLY